jgi:transposase
MKTRGGARPGSGRKPTPISESRAMTLWNDGVSKKDIAKRFGVDYQVVLYFFKKKRMFRR